MEFEAVEWIKVRTWKGWESYKIWDESPDSQKVEKWLLLQCSLSASCMFVTASTVAGRKKIVSPDQSFHPTISSIICYNSSLLQGLFLLLSKVLFFVDHLIFLESYYGGCLFFTEARPFWPMMVKIIPRLFINTIFNCPWNIKIHS